MDIAEVLKKAKRPERSVELCLDANLAAEHDDLDRQLSEARRHGAATMAATSESADIARKLRDIEDRMAASRVTFRVRGLPYFEREQFLEAHPPRNDKEIFNPVTGVVDLLAKTIVEPDGVTADSVRQLVDVLGTGQTDKLFGAAWQATNGDDAVPFSVAASLTLRDPEPKRD